VGWSRLVVFFSRGIDMVRQPAVYILANQRNGTLYTGVTSDLIKRIWEHKSDLVEGFTRRYAVHMLVYYELLDTMDAAISREKQIKAGSRAKKLQLIESLNIEWKDLYDSIL
jgi:putative endonuclease